MKLSQEQIDKISKVLERTTGIIALVSVILMLTLPKGAVGSWFVWTFIGLFFGFAILTGIVKNWATDEEAEEKKKLIKEAMQELQAEELMKKHNVPADECIKSPLKGLTPQQEEVVVDVLRNKILIVNGHLKTSELKHLLKALAVDGRLDDRDMDRVVDWVEQTTGQPVDRRNFKYDYTEKISDSQVSKWGNRIRERFEQIEIS